MTEIKVVLPKTRVLDIGCGPHRPKNADTVFPGSEWTGIDKTDFSYCYDGNFVQHDLRDPLPFPNNYFDAIWCHHVLEHLPPMHPYAYTDEYDGPQDFLICVLNEMWRVLKWGTATCGRGPHILKHGGQAHLIVPWIEHNNARRSPTHYRFFVPELFPCVAAWATPGNQSEWGHYGRWRCVRNEVTDATHVYAILEAFQYPSREAAANSIGRLELPDWVRYEEEE